MKRIVIGGAVAVVLGVGICVVMHRMRHEGATADTDLGDAVAAITELDAALRDPAGADILERVLVPAALAGRTAREQADFVRKALRDEVSAEGIDLLKETGSFGPLAEVFPGKADRWADLFGVNPTNCVAFRADRDGFRAEVVLLREDGGLRVLRCNNVKQLAATVEVQD